jgi:hypothetical protein
MLVEQSRQMAAEAIHGFEIFFIFHYPTRMVTQLFSISISMRFKLIRSAIKNTIERPYNPILGFVQPILSAS